VRYGLENLGNKNANPGTRAAKKSKAPIVLKRKIRVLTAEDNRTNRLVLDKMLAGLNIDLDFAFDGHEAIRKWEAGEYDMVFMDISMPKLDGIEATGKIRDIEAKTGRAPVPIVAMTAHAMTGDAARFQAAGMDHYLTKPLSKSLILEKIDEIIRAAPDNAPN